MRVIKDESVLLTQSKITGEYVLGQFPPVSPIMNAPPPTPSQDMVTIPAFLLNFLSARIEYLQDQLGAALVENGRLRLKFEEILQEADTMEELLSEDEDEGPDEE